MPCQKFQVFQCFRFFGFSLIVSMTRKRHESLACRFILYLSYKVVYLSVGFIYLFILHFLKEDDCVCHTLFELFTFRIVLFHSISLNSSYIFYMYHSDLISSYDLIFSQIVQYAQILTHPIIYSLILLDTPSFSFRYSHTLSYLSLS